MEDDWGDGNGREFTCLGVKGDADGGHSTFGNADLFTVFFLLKFESVGYGFGGDGFNEDVDCGGFFKL